MKELLSKYTSRKKEFGEYQREVERKFVKFLQDIPEWKERLEAIIVSQTAKDPGMLLPEVKNICLYQTGMISFDIRVPSDTWVSEWITVSPFPLSYLLDPDTIPYDPEYIKAKISRREKYLENLEEEMEGLKEDREKTEKEIARLRSLLWGEN